MKSKELKALITKNQDEIKYLIDECERIESILLNLGEQIAAIQNEEQALNATIRKTEKQQGYLQGLEAVGRIDADQAAELQALSENLVGMKAMQQTDYNGKIATLKAKQATVSNLLSIEQGNLNSLQDSLPGLHKQYYQAVFTETMPQFLKQSESMAEMIARLCALNDLADNTMMDYNAGFLLPVPYSLENSLSVKWYYSRHDSDTRCHKTMKPLIDKFKTELEI